MRWMYGFGSCNYDASMTLTTEVVWCWTSVVCAVEQASRKVRVTVKATVSMSVGFAVAMDLLRAHAIARVMFPAVQTLLP